MNLKSLNPIIRFAIIFVISYLLLGWLAGLEPMHKAQGRLFEKTVVPVLKLIYPNAEMQAEYPSGDINKLKIKFTDKAEMQRQVEEARRKGEYGALRVKSNSFPFYIKEFIRAPLLLLLALILSTPQGWKQKLKSLGLGLLLYWCFIAFKAAVIFHSALAEAGVYEQSNIIAWLVDILRLIGAGMLAMVIIWLIVAFPASLIRPFVKVLGGNDK